VTDPTGYAVDLEALTFFSMSATPRARSSSIFPSRMTATDTLGTPAASIEYVGLHDRRHPLVQRWFACGGAAPTS
jgi:hypothetical protein